MKQVKVFIAWCLEYIYSLLLGHMNRSGMILYAAHTSAASFTDTTYAISDDLPATYDAAGYAATTVVFTVIGKVESFPEFGATREVNKFTPIAGAIEYSKGVAEYGSGPMVVADVPADAGQVIVKAADASANHYSMKITYPDGEIHYLDVLVSGWVLTQATSGEFMKRTATINVCKAPVVVAAT